MNKKGPLWKSGPKFHWSKSLTKKSIPPPQVRAQAINIDDGEMRLLLRLSLSQLCAASPEGFFSWLESKHPKVHRELTGALPLAVTAAWRGGVRAEFTGAITNFLDAVSAAIAIFELKRGRR